MLGKVDSYATLGSIDSYATLGSVGFYFQNSTHFLSSALKTSIFPS